MLPTISSDGKKYRITNDQAKAKQVGKQRKKLAISVERIADASLYLLQNDSVVKNKLDYYSLREKAINELKDDFQKYNLVEDISLPKEKQKENKRKREIAIEQRIKKKIRSVGEFKTSIPLRKFLYLSGFISTEDGDFSEVKLPRVLNFIKIAQENSRIEWKEESISDDYKNIYYDLIMAYKIPEIKIRVDSSINEKINTLDDLVKSSNRNKLKYIKYIDFTFSSAALASFVAIGRKYIELEPQKRLKFKVSYSYRLEPFIRSIEHVQYIPHLNSFDLDFFNDMFSLSYRKFYQLYINVIVPGVEELNRVYAKDFTIEYTVKNFRKRNVKQFISFFIKRKRKKSEIVMFDSRLLEYYIASRIFFSIPDAEERKNNIPLFSSFLRYIETVVKTKDKNEKIGLYQNKEEIRNEPTIEEWEEEALKAYEAQKEIFIYIGENEEILNSLNIRYDRKMMCFIEGEEIEDIYQKKANIIRFGNIINNPVLSLEFLESELKWKVESVRKTL